MSRYFAIPLLTLGVALLPLPAAADAASEIVTAAQHAQYAAEATTLETVHAHLHHTLNCLVGPNGMDFDATAINPCKNAGNGAIPDTTDARKQKALETAASKARDGLKSNDLATAQKDAATTEKMLKGIK